jgi:hypothetical protein
MGIVEELEAAEPPEVKRARRVIQRWEQRNGHAAYAEPLDGGHKGYQGACWDCDWRGAGPTSATLSVRHRHTLRQRSLLTHTTSLNADAHHRRPRRAHRAADRVCAVVHPHSGGRLLHGRT